MKTQNFIEIITSIIIIAILSVCLFFSLHKPIQKEVIPDCAKAIECFFNDSTNLKEKVNPASHGLIIITQKDDMQSILPCLAVYVDNGQIVGYHLFATYNENKQHDAISDYDAIHSILSISGKNQFHDIDDKTCIIGTADNPIMILSLTKISESGYFKISVIYNKVKIL